MRGWRRLQSLRPSHQDQCCNNTSTSTPVSTTVPKRRGTVPAIGTSEKRKYFDCENVGHISSCCPKNKGNECNRVGHVAADCPSPAKQARGVKYVRFNHIHGAWMVPTAGEILLWIGVEERTVLASAERGEGEEWICG